MENLRLFRKVNKKLLPIKCHYFLYMAGLACALPFRTIFAKQLGISATAVGAIFFAVPFFKTVTNPLCGFILDYFKRFRLTISIILITMALSHLAMIFIPPRPMKFDNTGNITIQFHSRVIYSCKNETFSGDKSEHNIVIFSNYSALKNSSREYENYICDMECSDSLNDIYLTKNRLQDCRRNMSLGFKEVLNISSCNMDMKLENGRIFSTHGKTSNLIINEFNESSIISTASWNLFSEGNCSEDSNLRQRKINLTNYDQEVENINNFLGHDININEYFTLQYYILHKYTVISENKDGHSHCPCKLESNCFIKQCTSNISKDDDSALPISDETEFLSVQFWSLFTLIILSSTALSAAIFTIDTVSYEMLQNNKENYGNQRLWGTVGWGLGALAGGYLNGLTSADSGQTDYTLSFSLLILLIFIDLIPVYHMKVTEFKYSPHIWKDVCFLFTKAGLVYNFIIVYFIGALSGFIWNYQFWFMEEIGASQVLLGLSQTVESIFELPWFAVSGWIISKIGHRNSNNLTLLCFGLRYLCFAFMYDAWMTLPVGFFHGPTFGLFYASMTMFAKEEAPPGTEATVQSLLHLCFEGLGIATGTFVGGVGIDNFGSRKSFLYAAEISFLLLFINIIVYVWSLRFKKKTKAVEDPVYSLQQY